MTEDEKKELKGRLLSFVSRKFLIALVILIASTVMVMKNQLDATQWLGIVTADLLTYDFSNAYSKKAKKEW
jgi:hypothetical protein